MKNIVILISGRGSNFEAILERSRAERWAETIGADIRAVISNRPEAKGLVTARNNGIEAVALDHKTFASREEFDKALGDLVASYEPDLVVLAGFMRVLTPVFTDRFEGRMLNIHPALLPLFPGLHTHERAIEAGAPSSARRSFRCCPPTRPTRSPTADSFSNTSSIPPW